LFSSTEHAREHEIERYWKDRESTKGKKKEGFSLREEEREES
jgi:hypothetical protein